ncbi:hypothetical protein ACJX0J_012106 [Zea mays]
MMTFRLQIALDIVQIDYNLCTNQEIYNKNMFNITQELLLSTTTFFFNYFQCYMFSKIYLEIFISQKILEIFMYIILIKTTTQLIWLSHVGFVLGDIDPWFMDTS